MNTPPFILFVPSYGHGGTGEFVSAVTLAQAVAWRWPQARIEFLLPGGPGTRQDAPFPKTCHDGPRSGKALFNNQHIERLRPDLVIFDSGLHSKTLRCCRRLGIATAFVSGVELTRSKAFRLDRLFLIDQHWHQREHFGAPLFTPWQRFLSRFGRTRRLGFDTCLPVSPENKDDLPPEIAARLTRPFVLLSPGGGGFKIAGRPVSELFVEAADRIHDATGIECLTLLGPLYEGNVRGRTSWTLKAVSPGRFIDLMQRAQLVVINGGYSAGQAVACGAVCVAVPLNDTDQPARVRTYVEAGLLQTAAPHAADIATAALGLLDPVSHAAQRQRVSDQKLVNGIPMMCDAIARLLPMLNGEMAQERRVTLQP